jgi:predicted membrane channel-forming protein YqfA (hemolysin III family)
MSQTSSSFGAYEAFRIIIPGYYFATLLLCLLWSVPEIFGGNIQIEGTRLFLVFVGVGLIAGLTLYAKETTKRRKAFQENQPSLYLKTKARGIADVPVMEESDARQLYFFILNNHIPAVFHEKIFYFGTIYHIMIQVRRTTLWFAVLATLITAAMIGQGADFQALVGVLVFTAAAWLLYLLNVRYNKADRKMQENYRDQICWLEMNNDLVESVIRKRCTTQK